MCSRCRCAYLIAVGGLVHALQRERGQTCAMMAGGGHVSPEVASQDAILKNHEATDEALSKVQFIQSSDAHLGLDCAPRGRKSLCSSPGSVKKRSPNSPDSVGVGFGDVVDSPEEENLFEDLDGLRKEARSQELT